MTPRRKPAAGDLLPLGTEPVLAAGGLQRLVEFAHSALERFGGADLVDAELERLSPAAPELTNNAFSWPVAPTCRS